jgi:hypothetical protein
MSIGASAINISSPNGDNSNNYKVGMMLNFKMGWYILGKLYTS